METKSNKIQNTRCPICLSPLGRGSSGKQRFLSPCGSYAFYSYACLQEAMETHLIKSIKKPLNPNFSGQKDDDQVEEILDGEPQIAKLTYQPNQDLIYAAMQALARLDTIKIFFLWNHCKEYYEGTNLILKIKF